MTQRAIVIPFGVPEDGRGLGLGLAALLHGFSQVQGQSLGLAQVHSRERTASAQPVEAFISPNTWRELAAVSETPSDIALVVTGAFEPPNAGRGAIQLVAFDPKTGSTRAEFETHVDEDRAGAAVVRALEKVLESLGGDIGPARVLGELDWEALESVLLAERCALHDPARGGPHDRLAAMLHLGRAVSDAPGASYPAGRLAVIALEAATTREPILIQAAERALSRALEDAPTQAELIEAMAAIEIRLGRPLDGERRINALLARDPTRLRSYALLSEALRQVSRFDAALAVISQGIDRIGADPLLLIERAHACASRGEIEAAVDACRTILDRVPCHPLAFAKFAELATATKNGIWAQMLVDHALSAGSGNVDVLRRSLHLALAAESEGISRAARVEKLSRRLVESAPSDLWAQFILGRSLQELGERADALAIFRTLEQTATDPVVAAEAHRGRLALDNPDVVQELESLVRALRQSDVAELGECAARARQLAILHSTPVAWMISARCHERRGEWKQAQMSLREAVKLQPGLTEAHARLVRASVETMDPKLARLHADKAMELEGETARTLAAAALALEAAGHRDGALSTLQRARALDPDSEYVFAAAECMLKQRRWTKAFGRFASRFKK